MIPAEIVAEFFYHGTSLAEVAGFDDLQMRWICFRERDEQGSLVRNPGYAGPSRIRKEASFEGMFRQAKAYQGLNELEVDLSWQQYLDENPSLVKFLRRKEMEPWH